MILAEEPIKKSKEVSKKLKGKDRVSSHPMVDKIKNKMADDIVDFIFIKLDGSKRKATGTRNIEIVKSVGGKGQIPKGVREPSPRVLTFWDMDKKKWRCFRRDRFVSIGKSHEWNDETKKKYGTIKESIDCEYDKEFIRDLEFEQLFDSYVRNIGYLIEKYNVGYEDAIQIVSEQSENDFIKLNLNDSEIDYLCESAAKEIVAKYLLD